MKSNGNSQKGGFASCRDLGFMEVFNWALKNWLASNTPIQREGDASMEKHWGEYIWEQLAVSFLLEYISQGSGWWSVVLEGYTGMKLKQEYGFFMETVAGHRRLKATGYPSLKVSKRDLPGVDSLLPCKAGILKIPCRGFQKGCREIIHMVLLKFQHAVMFRMVLKGGSGGRGFPLASWQKRFF